MNFRSLLSKELNDSGIFSLFKKSVNINKDEITLFKDYVHEYEVMRMDKLCKRLYNSYDYIDVLCKLNGIYNPYSIQYGDVIFYGEIKDMDRFYNNEATVNKISTLINKVKKQREDSKRDKYINERETVIKLPPTIILDDSFNQVEYDGEKIRLQTNFGK